MSDITFLLNSCDSHSETWLPFFTLLKKMWPSMDYPVVLNTETGSFESQDFEINNVNVSDSVSWSDRLLKVLEKIDTTYVLVFLEDFFLESPVDLEHYNRCVSFMRENPDVGCVSFHNTPDGLESSSELKGYAKLKPNARFRANCQIGLWRTEVLKKILRKHENAWEFEVWASKRSGRLPYRFYSIVPGIQEVFDYDLGKPIYRGFWNMESVSKIEKKTGISIPTETLPHINNMSEVSLKTRKRTFKTYISRLKSLF